MDFYGYLIAFNGFLWISMDFYGYLMESYIFLYILCQKTHEQQVAVDGVCPNSGLKAVLDRYRCLFLRVYFCESIFARVFLREYSFCECIFASVFLRVYFYILMALTGQVSC